MLSQQSRSVLPLIGALFTLYIVWGSTYFVIRLGVAQWPPLMMAGIRFLTAGIVLFSFLAWRGHALPTLKQWLAAGAIGILLLAVGNGLVTVAEHQHVPSGIAAVMVATVPLFTLCFSLLWGMRNTKLEWAGIALGLVGIVLLNTGNNLVGNPTGALLICWLRPAGPLGRCWDRASRCRPGRWPARRRCWSPAWCYWQPAS